MWDDRVGPFWVTRTIGACVLSLLLASGCSDPDEKKDGEAAGSGGVSSAGTKATGGAGGRAGAGTMGGSAAGVGGSSGMAGSATMTMCNELELDAPPAGFSYDADAAPEAMGGELLDGTYFLTTQIMFGTPSGPTLPFGRTKITIEGDVWQEVTGDAEDGSVNQDQHIIRTLEVSGTTLTLTRICPNATAPRETEYTVDDAGFTVYIMDGGKTIGTVFSKQ
jgi:hypothetical protein